MRYKLMKDLPGYKAGQEFDNRLGYWLLSENNMLCGSTSIDKILDKAAKYPEFFQPIDDTSERWRAEAGGKFYSIDLDDGIQVSEYKEVGSNPNSSFTHDWELGNYFRTEQQAQAAAEAIRAVLAYIQAIYSRDDTPAQHAELTNVMDGITNARKAVQEGRD